MRTCTTLPLILAVGALSPAFALAQQAPSASHLLRGTVTAAGAAVRGADVFLLESLDAATTDTAGHFSIRTTAAGSVTVVARHIGFAPANLVVPVDTADAVTLALSPETAVLAPITVQAGAYKAGQRARRDAHGARGRHHARRHGRRRARDADAARRPERRRGHGALRARRRRERNESAAQQRRHALAVQLRNADGQLHGDGESVSRSTASSSARADSARATATFCPASPICARPGVRYRAAMTGVAGLASVSSRRRPRARPRTRGARDGRAQRHAISVQAERRRRARIRPRRTATTSAAASIYNYSPDRGDQDVRHRSRAARSASTSTIRRSTAATRPTCTAGCCRRLDATSSAPFSPTISVSYCHRTPQRRIRRVRPRHRRALVAALHANGVESATTDTPSASAAISTGATAASSARFRRRVAESRHRRAVHHVRFAGADGGGTACSAKPTGARSRICGSSPALRTDYSSFTHVRTVDPRLSAAYKLGDATLTAARRRLPSGVGSTVLRVGHRPARTRRRCRAHAVRARRTARRRKRESRASSSTTSGTRDLVGLTRDKVVDERRHRRSARRRRLRQAQDLAVLLGAARPTATSIRGAPTRTRGSSPRRHSTSRIPYHSSATRRCPRAGASARRGDTRPASRSRRSPARRSTNSLACGSPPYGAPNSDRLPPLKRVRPVASRASRGSPAATSSSTSSRSTTCSIATTSTSTPTTPTTRSAFPCAACSTAPSTSAASLTHLER